MSAKTMSSYIAKRKERTQLKGTHQMVKSRPDQVQNNAGGYVHKLSIWDTLQRFLILGSEGGTYYVGERKLTVDNAKNVEACVKEDGMATVDMIVDISRSGRAPKNDPALLALAICATVGASDVKGYAMAMLPEVARIGTHLFHFVEFANSIRGWGRLLREGIANWYTRLPVENLANQVIKYQQRDGWSHRDLLRLSHPKPDSDVRSNLFRYVVKGGEAMKQGDEIPSLVIGFELAKNATTAKLVQLIDTYGLTREMIPTEKLNDVPVWEALLENMPMMAMIRNLGKMSSIGLLRDSSDAAAKVVSALTDASVLRKARVHPFNVLVALHQYKQGKGLKGSLTWTPSKQVINALDEAFYGAFQNVEPSGKRIELALDVSGSMGIAFLNNSSISAREASAAMAMVTVRSEQNYELSGFSTTYLNLQDRIKPTMKLDQVVRAISGLPFSGTDCSLPMVNAIKTGKKVDAFVIYTDSETYAGVVKPVEALKQYRDKTGINAKLIVVGMTATNFTIADPKDRGMLDVVGFDTTAPDVISAFTSDQF